METQNDKIKVVFEKLLTYLAPKEIHKKSYPAKTYAYGIKEPGYTIYKAECSFLNTNIPLPYSDIIVEVTETNICILSDNFEYNFAPDQILTIWNRIKKTLKN